MAGLVPTVHVFVAAKQKDVDTPAPRPDMTKLKVL